MSSKTPAPAPTTPISNSLPTTSKSTTPPGSARRKRGRGRKGKAWKEAKSWRRDPIQSGDMAAVHSESSESSSAGEEGTGTPKQNLEMAFDSEKDKDVEPSVDNLGKETEPVDAEVVVGTPPKAFVRSPIQFGYMAAVHCERPEPSMPMEENTGTPKQSLKMALDSEKNEDVETTMDNPEKEIQPVDAEVMVGTPPKAFVPKGEFVWADEFDKEEEVAEEGEAEESSDFVAFATASSQEEEAAAKEEVL
ncbi:hypothetical protein DL95DRAFT_379739, partial [Leptodontidium sp. 2 PMI_412]